jgi:hypothetical protein
MWKALHTPQAVSRGVMFCWNILSVTHDILKGLLVQAETAGHQPHMFLASVLKQGDFFCSQFYVHRYHRQAFATE